MTRGQLKIFRCGIAGVEAVESKTRHIFPRHTHDQFGVGVIHRGAQRSLSGRGMVEAGSGDTITVNPGEVHDGAPFGDAGRSWRMLDLDRSLIAQATCDMSEGKARACELSRPVIRDAGLSAGSGANDVILVGELTLVVRGIVNRRPPSWLAIGESLTVHVDGQHLHASLKRPAALRALNCVRVVAWVGHGSLVAFVNSGVPFVRPGEASE